jgi:hypothetical protein
VDDKDNFLHGVRDLLSIHSSNDHTFFPSTRLSIQVIAGIFSFSASILIVFLLCPFS